MHSLQGFSSCLLQDQASRLAPSVDAFAGDSAQRRKLSGGRDLAPPRPRASSSFTFLSAESGSCQSSMDDPDCDSTWEDESEEDGEDGQADDTTDEDSGDDDGDAEEARPGLFQVRRGRTGGRQDDARP